ncbi:head GIN domain-containing protein [Aquimarina brevivitae]|uniref:Putative autotransporter adhesin-like protein n=1 Tax=Aquimarina brevivitae TaxID=323412 RepID=A0A4Q7P0W4_9FLAO|nr:head GIN domain-containing protein [Aquimarina brevivitae]RZS93314.1 putative autotransporter adhesin-like protein [Aquimarina brevivitae]
MTTLVKILVTAFLSLFLASCNMNFNGIQGEGEVIRKEKTIDKAFTGVKASKGLDVILIKSDDAKVIVEANENLHQHIEVYVENNTLYVTSDKNIYRADEKNVFVSYKSLNKIASSSGASISSEATVVERNLTLKASSGSDIELSVRAETLQSSVSSGAHIELSGQANRHDAKASSGADIKSRDMESLIASATASSGSSIKIHAKQEFRGKASSGADINYYGNPEKIDEVENSGGNVRRN